MYCCRSNLSRSAQFVARVYLLLENSQIIPNHDDFVEECLERDFFRLKRTVRRLHRCVRWTSMRARDYPDKSRMKNSESFLPTLASRMSNVRSDPTCSVGLNVA